VSLISAVFLLRLTSTCHSKEGTNQFNYQFSESYFDTDHKCSNNYPGNKAFSEIENRNIRDYIQSLKPAPTYANAFHSFGELLLYPYGYAVQEYPDNVLDLASQSYYTLTFILFNWFFTRLRST
jgi:hypothetical protein